MLNLKIRDTARTITLKLDELLVDKNSVEACCKNVAKVPLTKGIYFWFMPNEAYKKLREYVTILPIVPVYQKVINGILHDLVYIGTAGTGKNGNSNINERLTWHLCNKHTKSAVCSGTLSTLRAGLGALLAEDLILPNTEAEVNEFMCDYMKVYWIAYGDNDKDLIDSDESKLIKELRPLLNIKNNPNAAIAATTTYTYKQRRALVYDATKKRLNCVDPEVTTTEKELKRPAPTISAEKLINESDDCQTFSVTAEQSIVDVVNNIPNLPQGPCKVICWNTANPNQIVYANAKGEGWRNTGKGNQNIYSYFANVDTGMGNQYRWKIIQDEMARKSITRIDVVVCKLSENSQKKNTSNSNQIKEIEKRKPATPVMEREKKLEILRNPEIPKLLIIGCSDAKQTGGKLMVNPRNIFHNELLELRGNRRNYYGNLFGANPNHFIRNGNNEFQRFNQANNNNLLLPAYKRYDGMFFSPGHRTQYECVNNNHGWHILIISGLYGVLEYRDEIIDYHLTIQKGGNWHGNEIHNCIQNYKQNNGINDDKVFYSLSNSYVNAINGLPRWHNLWQGGGGHGHASATSLCDFLKLFSICK